MLITPPEILALVKKDRNSDAERDAYDEWLDIASSQTSIDLGVPVEFSLCQCHCYQIRLIRFLMPSLVPSGMEPNSD